MCVSRHLNKELAWAIDKWLWFISNTKTTKNLKNKAIFNLKQCCMCYYLVKTIVQKCANFTSNFLAKLARSCTKSCTKNEVYIKKLQDNFLARFKLARKLSCNFSCKILAKFLYLAGKISFLNQARRPVAGACLVS